MLEEQNSNEPQNSQLNIGAVKRSALDYSLKYGISLFRFDSIYYRLDNCLVRFTRRNKRRNGNTWLDVFLVYFYGYMANRFCLSS